MTANPTEALTVIEAVDHAPQQLGIAGGEAVVASFRAPDKQGDNEDAAAIVPLGHHGAILAVADGVGSSRGAQLASAATVEALAKIRCEEGVDPRASIVNAIEHVNQRVRESAPGSATTLALVAVANHAVRPIHIGDSAVVVVGQRGRLRLQTVAHSPIGYAIEAGVIDEGEAMHHEDRHLVSNVIGSADMRIEVGTSLPLARHDTVLLATDGVLDNLHLDELIELVRAGPIGRAAERVMGAVRARMTAPVEGVPSKPDDTTLVLYRRTS